MRVRGLPYLPVGKDSMHAIVCLVFACPAAHLGVAEVADLQQRALAVVQQRVLQLYVPVRHALCKHGFFGVYHPALVLLLNCNVLKCSLVPVALLLMQRRVQRHAGQL